LGELGALDRVCSVAAWATGSVRSATTRLPVVIGSAPSDLELVVPGRQHLKVTLDQASPVVVDWRGGHFFVAGEPVVRHALGEGDCIDWHGYRLQFRFSR
jgi:hypothetical protein